MAGSPSFGGAAPPPAADRMQALLARAAEEQLSEQRSVHNAMVASGADIRLTPPTSAKSHSPERRPWQA